MVTAHFVLLMLTLVDSALGDCYWSSCDSKVLSPGVFSCRTGYHHVPFRNRDCGNQVCILGLCDFPDEENMCCQNCNWWDADCNWEAIQRYFKVPTDAIKSAWKLLSREVQEMIADWKKFKELTDEQLLSLSVDLLSELTSVLGMTLHQLGVITDKVASMAVDHLQHFLDSLNVETLTNGISSLAATALDWSAEQVSVLMEKLVSMDLWGPIASWTTSQIASLGKFVRNMSLGTLSSFLLDVNPVDLGLSMVSLTGETVAWGLEHAAAFIRKLTSPEVWGSIADWTVDKISALGSMINSLDVPSIMEMNSWAFAHAANIATLTVATVGKLGKKMFGMNIGALIAMLGHVNSTVLAESISLITSIDFNWAAEQAIEFVTKLGEAWGDVASWTSDQVSKLGSLLVHLPAHLLAQLGDLALSKSTNLVKFGAAQLGSLAAKLFGMPIAILKVVLDSVNGTALCEGLVGITKDYMWAPEKTSTFIARLISPEVCGQISHWTSEKIGALGSMIDSLNLQTIMEMNNLAFAHATNLVKLSVTTLSKLGGKMLEMTAATLTTMLSNVGSAVFAGSISLMNGFAWAADQASALLEKLRELWGDVASWTSAQLESLQELAAGLSPMELAAIPLQIIRGLKAYAITAMNSTAVKGFRPEQISSMTDYVRHRIHGNLLKALSPEQIIAAVCGAVTFPVGDESQSLCPPAIIDLSIIVPEDRANFSLDHLLDQVNQPIPVIDPSGVTVLMNASQDELPRAFDGRRLATDDRTITIRIGVQDVSRREAITSAMQSAAASFAASLGGSVVQEAESYVVDPSPADSFLSGAPSKFPQLLCAVMVTWLTLHHFA